MKALRLLSRLMSKPYFWPLLIVILFGWLASMPLFGSGYFNMHDDLQMMRQLQIEKCFLDGQIPCRWVPDMGYGFGFPLFNFYPPLPYLVGELIRLLGFSFVDTAKGLFIIAFIASGVTMYFFAKEFFGKLGGVLAAIFYIWAPYHAVDIYVRGAMNEAWALIFFPVILLFSYKLISNKKPSYSLLTTIYLALSLAGLLLSHNLMVMIFAPVLAVWSIFWILRFKAWKNIFYLALSGLLGLGLAAFFTIPVFWEQKLVHADTLVAGYFEFVAHFSSIGQILFSRFWGYGPSVWMEIDDKMSFQIGHFHWILSIVILILAVTKFFRSKNKDTKYLILATIYFILIGWVAAFMTHSKSVYIWQAISPLRYVQFPWRFLTLVILGFSFAAGILPMLLPKKLAIPASLVLILGLVMFNWNYFKPEYGKLGPLTDEQKFAGAAWDLQRTAGIYDYLPRSAKENPRDGQNGVAEIVKGRGDILNPMQGTDWSSFEADSPQGATVRINTYLFPEWRIFIDDQEVEITVPEEEKWGRMHIEVPPGRHSVYAKLFDTPVREFGNIVSLASWSLLAVLIYKSRHVS